MSSTSNSSSNSTSSSNNNIGRNAVVYQANANNNSPSIKKGKKKGNIISKNSKNIGKYFLFGLVILTIIILIIYFLHLFKVVHIPYFQKDEEKKKS